MVLLDVRHLSTRFAIAAGTVEALGGVDFVLGEGEALGIVGESGSGKTTLALSIARLHAGEADIGGRVLFDGTDLLSLSDEAMRARRWKEIAVIFQGAMNALNPVMTVGRQVAEALVLHEGCTGAAARRRVAALFRMVEIDPTRIDQYPHEFSGGMRQRVMIAMALACRPRLVIADEPTTGLDVMVQAQILELMGRLCREGRMGLILITHDLSVLTQIADRVAVMYGGNIVEIAAAGDILAGGVHPYTRRLAGAVPDVSGKREMARSIPGDPPNLISPPPGCRFHPRCALAEVRCRTEAPALREVGGGHRAACHRLGGGAP